MRCWGLNDYGQLGDGTMTIVDSPGAPNPTPLPVVGITGAAAIAGGGFHTCARFPDGTLQCWGRHSEGQLGDPATSAFVSPTPVPVTGITTATAVSAGGFHTCALLANGTVQCWGQNDQGQLGSGIISPPFVPNVIPVEVTGITTATVISAGGWHTCALLQNGTVRCWGDNERGAVGDGTPITTPFIHRPTPTPVTVQGIDTAIAIKSGIFHTCALLQDGAVRCWGWNTFGQLGNDPPAINASSTPATVSGITNPAVLAPGAEHTCVLLAGGTPRCWGDNTFGQLGNDSPRGPGPLNPGAAAPVTGITTATALTSGAEHTCALLPGGTMQCWGRGLFGRLGVGVTTGADAFVPEPVVGLGVTWTSSDPTVAIIDATGLATGRNPGSTTITAAGGDRSWSTTLTVVNRFSLSVIRDGTGLGTVTSDPPGINCRATCSASYDENTVVTLTASPAADSTFEGWAGGGCSGTDPCAVTLAADTTVFARFGIRPVTLAVSREGSGLGTVTSDPYGIDCGATCSASYPSGTVVTLTARPATGSIFEGWTAGGCSGTAPCPLTLTDTTTVSARFADVTAPVLELPGDIVTTTTRPFGAVVAFAVSASDNVDAAPLVTCSCLSETEFPVGTTVVTCTSGDSAGNVASKTFRVTVIWLPWLLPPEPLLPGLLPPGLL